MLLLPSSRTTRLGSAVTPLCFYCSAGSAPDIFFSPGSCRILALEKLGAVFNQVAFPLQYTPRKFVIHPESNNLIVIETDHNAYTEATKAQRKQQMAEVNVAVQQGSRLLPESTSSEEQGAQHTAAWSSLWANCLSVWTAGCCEADSDPDSLCSSAADLLCIYGKGHLFFCPPFLTVVR